MKNRLSSILLAALLMLFIFSSCSDELAQGQLKALNKEYGSSSLYAQQYPELYAQDEDDLWHELMRIDDHRRYEIGVITALRLLEFSPEDDEVYHELGFCLSALGDDRRAALMYQRALHFNPQNHASLYNLGELYITHQRYYEAQHVLEQAYELDPDNHQYAIQLAKVYFILHREVDALALYLPIIYSQKENFFAALPPTLYQMYADVYYDLALLYWQAYTQAQNALFYLDQYEELVPGDEDAQRLRALIMRSQLENKEELDV